jgi:hypothetical protein
MTAILYRYETYCELIMSNGRNITGKKAALERWCKQEGIQITETVDKREKKQRVSISDPANPKSWNW